MPSQLQTSTCRKTTHAKIIEIATIILYCFALVLVFAALKVITAKNPVHMTLFFVLSFLTTTTIWILLRAEFLAIALVLIYIGAVVVLPLFMVTIVDIDIEYLRRDFWTYVSMAALVSVVIILEMVVVLTRTFMGRVQSVQELPKGFNGPNTQTLGKLICTDYIYASEVVGAALLLAIMAAVALTAHRRKDTKAQNVSDQIRVKRKDRVRLISIPAEKSAGAASVESEG